MGEVGGCSLVCCSNRSGSSASAAPTAGGPPAEGPLQPGEAVRVCSDSVGRLSCGVEGMVCRVRNGKVQLRTAVLAVHEVPEAAVRRCSDLKPPARMRPLREITGLQREGWLVRAGWNEHSLQAKTPSRGV